MQHIQIGYIENIMWVYNKITKFPNFTETIKMLLKYLQLFVSLYGYNSQGVSRKKNTEFRIHEWPLSQTTNTTCNLCIIYVFILSGVVV